MFNPSKNIEKKLESYRELFTDSLNCFRAGISQYINSGPGSDFDFFVNKLMKAESGLDSIRRETEYEMYSRGLLPEFRGDILKLLEMTDIIPNRLQACLFQLQCEKIRFPAEIIPDLKSLMDYTYSACETALKSFNSVMTGDRGKVLEYSREIDGFEGFCDHLERRIITDIFNLPLDTGEKILLKMFIDRAGKISDSAQRIAEFTIIMSVKGQV